MTLTSARHAARELATESRIDIPPLHRSLYVDLDDEEILSFATKPLLLWRLVGIGENHSKSPAKNPLPVESEIIRRFIALARDLILISQSYTAARMLLGLSTEEIAVIRKLTDDGVEAMMKSSRISFVPRVAPEERFRKEDMTWDDDAIVNKCVVLADNMVTAQ